MCICKAAQNAITRARTFLNVLVCVCVDWYLCFSLPFFVADDSFFAFLFSSQAHSHACLHLRRVCGSGSNRFQLGVVPAGSLGGKRVFMQNLSIFCVRNETFFTSAK